MIALQVDSCKAVTSVTPTAPPIDSHIELTKPHPYFGVRPWAKQSQGCGIPGDKIELGSEIFSSKSNISHVHTAKLLLAAWVQFRWGVFDENGHKDDEIYPPMYIDSETLSLKPNRCLEPSDRHAPFCSNANHIPEAPTKQNSLCAGKSAWDVIMQSQDFINDR